MKNLQEYIGEQLGYPDKGVKFNPSKLNLVGLRGAYELICDEYRRRLCEIWEVPVDESWWICDRVGTELCIADSPWGLDMEMIRYIVENNIGFKSFMEWWDFVESEISNGQRLPRINFRSWFENNCRPEILKD